MRDDELIGAGKRRATPSVVGASEQTRAPEHDAVPAGPDLAGENSPLAAQIPAIVSPEQEQSQEFSQWLLPYPNMLAGYLQLEELGALPASGGGDHDQHIGLGEDPGMPCDACHEVRPEPDYDGRKVGTWHGFYDTELFAGQRIASGLADLGEAKGHARSLGKAAVILFDAGVYDVYDLDYSWSIFSFSRQVILNGDGSVPLSAERDVMAFFTEDSWAVDASACSADGATGLHMESLSDGAGSDRFNEIFDAHGEGLEGLADAPDQLVTAFEVAMKLMMLDVLDDTETKALARPEEFDGEYPQILAIALAIDATEQELMEQEVQRRAAVEQQACEDCHDAPWSDERAKELLIQHATLRLKFPLLARFEPIGPFLELSKEDQIAALSQEVSGLLTSVRETRQYLLADRLELWTLPPLVDATMGAGGFSDPATQEVIDRRVAAAVWNETSGNVAMAVLSVGLGFAAGMATGGLAAPLAAAAFGVGATDATWQTREYFEDLALSNTAEDPTRSLVSPAQMHGAEFWIAVAWVGAGIDLVGATKALELLKTGATLSDALVAIGRKGRDAAVLAATHAENLMDELIRLLPDPAQLGRRLGGGLEPELTPAMAGAPRAPSNAFGPKWWESTSRETRGVRTVESRGAGGGGALDRGGVGGKGEPSASTAVGRSGDEASQGLAGEHGEALAPKGAVGQDGEFLESKGSLSHIDEFVDLTEHRSAHILNRHRAGAGTAGKTEFPASWSDDRIRHQVSDIATDPAATTGVGKWNSPYAIGVRDGIEIRVDFYPPTHPKYAGQISTAYPINVTPNP